MKKSILIVVVIAIAALVFTGCSTLNQGTAANAPEASKLDNLFGKIKAEGVIRIGTEGTYAPFTFYNKEGKLTGFDVEIAEEIARRLDLRVEFIETKWDGMFAGLDAKRFDAIANQVTIKADRLEKYDFSDPYISSKAVLVVHGDNSEIVSFEDLKGRKSGQSLTSNLAEIATSYGAELVQVDGFNQAIDLLTSERIDATINDRLSFLDYKNQRPDTPIKVVAEMDTKKYMGIMFNKGNEELVNAFNEALSEMKTDGTYLAISQKWFATDVSE